MSGINRVILVGRLGQNPEAKKLDSGRMMATFSVATSDKWADKVTGEKVEKTEWHRVVAWGKTAELIERYLLKGREVCVEGRLQTRSWEDKDGIKRYMTEVVASSVTFLGSAKVEAVPLEVAA